MTQQRMGVGQRFTWDSGPWLAMALAGAVMGAVSAEEPPTPITYTGRVEDPARVCMMQDNVQARPGLKHVYQGKTYYLCCQGCVQGFKANPERFAYAIDPVSGERVDKAQAGIYAYAGRAYFFSTEEHLTTFAQDPRPYLQKMSSVEACEEPGVHASAPGCQAEGVTPTSAEMQHAR